MAAVHRDIKPENVILRGGDAVLIDFDAARLYKPEQILEGCCPVSMTLINTPME